MTARRPSLWPIDGVGAVIMLCITAVLYVAFLQPALDLSAREEETRLRLASMRSNLLALRLRARQLELRVAEAGALADEQVDLQPGDALLTRRAELTALLGEHELLLDEFASAGVTQADGYHRHALTIRAAGAFPDIVTMLGALHARFPDTLIASVEVTGRPLASSAERQLTLGLLWYAAPVR
ncbi:MAG: hypothetical protein ACF8R7_09275 [Phycisphaerales bacterium JB039]